MNKHSCHEKQRYRQMALRKHRQVMMNCIEKLKNVHNGIRTSMDAANLDSLV